MPSTTEDAHMCLYTLGHKTWAIEPKEFWTLLQQLLGVSTLLRPSVFFAFYDGGEWEIGGESMYVCDHTNQHLLYHPMQGEAAFENPKLFCVGVFQKKKAKMHYFSFACFEMGADGDNCIPSSNEVK